MGYHLFSQLYSAYPIHNKLCPAFCIPWILQIFMDFIFKLSFGSPTVQCQQVDLCRQQVDKSPMYCVCLQKRFLSIPALFVFRQELSPLVIFILIFLLRKNCLSIEVEYFLRGKCTQVIWKQVLLMLQEYSCCFLALNGEAGAPGTCSNNRFNCGSCFGKIPSPWSFATNIFRQGGIWQTKLANWLWTV